MFKGIIMKLSVYKPKLLNKAASTVYENHIANEQIRSDVQTETKGVLSSKEVADIICLYIYGATNKDISKLFPKSNIWIFVLNDNIDFMGFFRLQNEIKLRSKFVGQGRPFLDFGELHPIKQKLYNDYSEILFEDKKIEQVRLNLLFCYL